MNFAQGSQEFRIESQNLSKQRKLFLGERSTEQRTARISGELKELSDVCLYYISLTTQAGPGVKVAKSGALAPKWRFGKFLWRQKLSQAP